MAELQIHRRNGRAPVTLLVDDSDYDSVRSYPWAIDARGYARGPVDGKRTYLHRLLMGLQPGDMRHVDHISGDTFDNRRSNLRVLTPHEHLKARRHQPRRPMRKHQTHTTLSIGVDLYEELADYHRHGSRHKLIRKAWVHYRDNVLKKNKVKQ